jgi:hypothetical protein
MPDTMIFAHHTQVMMQSSFKPRPPSFIEEIERDLRATTMRADHIIFMGYSLPQDDVTYRAFFSARRQRSGLEGVHCTVVDKVAGDPAWCGPDELKRRIAAGALKECQVVHRRHSQRLPGLREGNGRQIAPVANLVQISTISPSFVGNGPTQANPCGRIAPD